jgi:hypothetical protein
MGYTLYYVKSYTTQYDQLKSGVTSYGFTYDTYDPAFDAAWWQTSDINYFYTDQAY